MSVVPEHDCQPPSRPVGDEGPTRWECPVCGHRHRFERRQVGGRDVWRWVPCRPRGGVRGPGGAFHEGLREAYELEQMAAAAPPLALWSRWRMRRRARFLRRLAGQR